MGNWKRNSTLPDRIDDPVLGTIRFTNALDGMDEYQAELKLDGRRVTFDLYTDGTGRLQPCIIRARKIVDRFPAIQQKMQRYVENNILPSYNKIWCENKKPITLKSMIGKLKLTQISTHPGPEATFWFDAGNLFAGHVLQLRMAKRTDLSITTHLADSGQIRIAGYQNIAPESRNRGVFKWTITCRDQANLDVMLLRNVV